ncbi:MAG TPA: hypothetical protein VNN18_00380 [Candidatus Xenobia bacterium]|nr:hypothetical protein [Candidatus Xenobia bacterium]
MSRWNLLPLGGFIIVAAAFLSYYLYFAYFPVTRDVPWLSFGFFALGLVVLGAGVRRAFAQPGRWFAKLAAGLLSVLSVLILGFFIFHIVSLSAQLPASKGAPKVGVKAPNFTLPDTNNQPVTLSEVVTSLGNEPGKDHYVLLVFYRGYW